jgi:DNA-binding MarR family transcriptional regulator
MSERLANLLAAAAQLVNDEVRKRLDDELSRTASAPAALATIAHYRGISIEELRAALSLTHSGAVRLVDRLEHDGLVQRARTGSREVRLSLTQAGRRALRRLESVRLAATAELIAPLAAEDRRQLELLLRSMLAARTRGEGDLQRICRLCSFEACESGGRRCPVAEAARTAAAPGVEEH